MKFFKKYSGILLIFVGVCTLMTLHLLRFTFINSLLLAPLFLIIAGIILHVYLLKKQSNY